MAKKIKKQPDWRPRIKVGQVTLRRRDNFLVVICWNLEEADACEKAIVRSLTKSRSKVL